MADLEVPDVLFSWATERRKETKARNGDHVILFIGEPGHGKSTLALQMAALMDPSFTMATMDDRISWSTKRHKAKAIRGAPWQARILDESTRGAFRRDAMGTPNKEWIKWLAECRDLHQYHMVLMQWEEMLEKIIASGRAKWKVELPRIGHAVFQRRGANGFYKKVFEFDFKPLDGTPVWNHYLELKGARSERVWRTGTDVKPEVEDTPLLKAVDSCVPLVQDLATQAQLLSEDEP